MQHHHNWRSISLLPLFRFPEVSFKHAVVALAVTSAVLLASADRSLGTPNPAFRTVPVEGGDAVLEFGTGFKGKLARDDIGVGGIRGGRVRDRRSVALKVRGGTMAPATGMAALRVPAGFVLRRGGHSVKVSGFTISLGPSLKLPPAAELPEEPSVVLAHVGAKRIDLASPDRISGRHAGFNVDAFAQRLRLGGAAAVIINRKLGLSGKARLRGGERIGSFSFALRPARVRIRTGEADLLPGGGQTLAKLSSKGIAPSTGITTPPPATSIPSSMPPGFQLQLGLYFGGFVLPDGTDGNVGLGGGMAFTKEGGQPSILFANIRFHFGEGTIRGDTYVDGVKVATDAVFAETAALPVPDPERRVFEIEGGTAAMTSDIAAFLNNEFPGGSDFVAGDPLCTFSMLIVAE